MSEIRARFTRGSQIMYISHLDLMRTIERAMRRAGLPVAYSQGFNPHAQMVFGLPLSVGVTSEAEYADFQMVGEISTEEFRERLNASLPEGIKIIEAEYKTTRSNIMSDIARASYDIRVLTSWEKGINKLKSDVDEFMSKPEIMAEKEGKAGIKQINIRPMVYEFKLLDETPREDGEEGLQENFSVFLGAGSAANLKPELLMKAFAAFSCMKYDYLKIHRTGLFVEMNGKTVSPLDERVLKA